MVAESNSWSRRAFAALLMPAILAACTQGPPIVSPRLNEAALPLQPTNATRVTLANFETTPFPFRGISPATGRPFLDVNDNGRLGHSSQRNGVLWADQTYNDKRVLLAVPKGFDPRRAAAIVVYMHGNEATLERDVRDRQGVPRQLVESGLNAVLVAPQFAVDARDSSAGRFWEPGVFHQFLKESARRLAELYGTRDAEFVFDNAPVILVAYSGGYVPAASALRFGHIGSRLRGVVLLDAVYGDMDVFAAYATNRGQGFLVSLYGHSSRQGNEALRRMIEARGITVGSSLAALGPRSVVFQDLGDDLPHVDFVTAALGGDPLARILAAVQGFPKSPGIGEVASQ